MYVVALDSGMRQGELFGLTWADYNNFVVRAYWAHKLGNAVATSAPDAKSRFWIQGVMYF